MIEIILLIIAIVLVVKFISFIKNLISTVINFIKKHFLAVTAVLAVISLVTGLIPVLLIIMIYWAWKLYNYLGVQRRIRLEQQEAQRRYVSWYNQEIPNNFPADKIVSHITNKMFNVTSSSENEDSGIFQEDSIPLGRANSFLIPTCNLNTAIQSVIYFLR